MVESTAGGGRPPARSCALTWRRCAAPRQGLACWLPTSWTYFHRRVPCSEQQVQHPTTCCLVSTSCRSAPSRLRSSAEVSRRCTSATAWRRASLACEVAGMRQMVVRGLGGARSDTDRQRTPQRPPHLLYNTDAHEDSSPISLRASEREQEAIKGAVEDDTLAFAHGHFFRSPAPAASRSSAWRAKSEVPALYGRKAARLKSLPLGRDGEHPGAGGRTAELCEAVGRCACQGECWWGRASCERAPDLRPHYAGRATEVSYRARQHATLAAPCHRVPPPPPPAACRDTLNASPSVACRSTTCARCWSLRCARSRRCCPTCCPTF